MNENKFKINSINLNFAENKSTGKPLLLLHGRTAN
jgi:hypothetical protein